MKEVKRPEVLVVNEDYLMAPGSNTRNHVTYMDDILPDDYEDVLDGAIEAESRYPDKVTVLWSCAI